MSRRLSWSVWGCIALVAASAARADVRLPEFFSSGMVLQRDQPVPIWGWADPGEAVTVSFRDQHRATTADQYGKWRIELAALSLGPASTLRVAGRNWIDCENVLVGDVGVCSGQSNMEWRMRDSFGFDLERPGSNEPEIRIFTVERATSKDLREDLVGDWLVCSPQTVGEFSGVGYYFARELHRILHVPIGLIHSSWGGTPAEAWTSPDGMASSPVLKPLLDSWAARRQAYDGVKAKRDFEIFSNIYAAQTAEREKKVRDARAAGVDEATIPPLGPPPLFQPEPALTQLHPSGLYNAMIAPFVGYRMRGVIWYQGESNYDRGYEYRTLLPVMIQSWRNSWGQGDFPFIQVQLANYSPESALPEESDWAEVREAQWMTTQALPKVWAACATDVGAATDIHPRDKRAVGERLARLALVHEYQVNGIIPQGPTYRQGSLSIDGEKARLAFETYGSRVGQYYHDPLTGFAVAGEDRVWHWAAAVITGPDTIEVWSDKVAHPVAVRYNWANNPQGNFHNTEMLPTYPFRTDDWPGVTAGKFGL